MAKSTAPPFSTSNPPSGFEQVPPATVATGDVDISGAFDQNAIYDDVEITSAIWQDYRVINRYENDKRLWMMGITSPNGFQGQKVAFCQMTAPTLLWIADWTASRTGDVPLVPNPNILDSNWVFLDEHVEPAMILAMADGITPIYRVSGTYVYGCLNPDLAQVIIPCPPWLDYTTLQRTVPGAAYTQGIINLPQSTLKAGFGNPAGQVAPGKGTQ